MSAAESPGTPSEKAGAPTAEPSSGAEGSGSKPPAGSPSASTAGPSFFLRKAAQAQKAAAEKKKPKGFETGSGQTARPGKAQGGASASKPAAKRPTKADKPSSKSKAKTGPRSKSKRSSSGKPTKKKKKKDTGQGKEPAGPQFTPEQNSVIQKVLFEHKNVFFTGAAGTGKSFVLKYIIQKLSEQLDVNQFSTTAPSGIAAFNIGGMTIHSFAGIGFGDAPVEQLLHEMGRRRNVLKRWNATRVLIIDEVSMLSGELLDKLNTIAKRIRYNPAPFGGIQLVVTGDFFSTATCQSKASRV
eukprot:INCI16289.14.p3 GENE.INCI16289.14~~INCI16289.14.p3  ORF type:complete len:299 (+),score=66.33 INCI16289.14:195-1091(+)